jgi:sodium-dependent dicarboxylate transporter 2/3/5
MTALRHYGLFIGLGFFGLMMQLPAPEGLSPEGWHVLAVSVWMITWWMTEAAPVAVTALVPLVAFPLVGVSTFRDIAYDYTSESVLLTLGGFMLGLGLERWNLHLRFALTLVKAAGTESHRIIGGFMLACALISMWITNATAALIMLPIAVSTAHLLSEERGGDEHYKRNFGTALLLGVAYSASIGGMMTLVGTSTNMIFKGFLEDNFDLQINFVDWLKLGVPVGLALLGCAWFLLCYVLFPCDKNHHESAGALVQRKLAELGKLSGAEKLVLLVFGITVTLWVSRELLHDHIPHLVLSDAAIALLGGILLFIIPAPADAADSQKTRLLEWRDTRDLPWGILLLLGGGLAMADMLNDHGVADWIGNGLSTLGTAPIVVILLIVIIAVMFMTEFMSNAAVITAFLPVLSGLALSYGQNPLLLTAPAALAASCAFMLPIATPPNAIVYSTHLMTAPQMARAGLWLNLAAIVILTLAAYFILPAAFEIRLGEVPEWARI